VNRNEHAAARRERVKDASVMCLEAHAPHRPRKTEFCQITGPALDGGDQRTSGDDGANAGEVNPLSRRTKRAFDEGRRIWTVFDEDAERLDGEASPNQRVNALLRPGEILKNTYRESIDVGLDHGGNVSR
jgi:hypothetical protein